jgi:hypothetical protein
MTNEERMNAAIQEVALQRNQMGERAANLAIALAEAQEKVKELEDKLVALAKGEAPTESNVVDLPRSPS